MSRKEVKKIFNNKFLGIVAFAITFVSLITLVGNSAYAEKKPKGPELPEASALPVCPTCKNVPASHTKGIVTASLIMVCPECKKEVSELRVYHCDKCKKDFLACPLCQMTSKAVTKAQIIKRYLQHISREK